MRLLEQNNFKMLLLKNSDMELHRFKNDGSKTGIFYISYQLATVIGSTAKNGFQIRIVQQKIHNVKKALFLI